MAEEIRFYKGKYRVKVLTKNRGKWTLEALEPIEDSASGQKVSIKAGERLTAASNLLFKRKGLPFPLKEHVYELKMEKKLKRLIAEEEKKQADKTT